MRVAKRGRVTHGVGVEHRLEHAKVYRYRRAPAMFLSKYGGFSC
jgi:hypothetical protein